MSGWVIGETTGNTMPNPTLEEVLLRKATHIAPSSQSIPSNWSRAEMPPIPGGGSITKILSDDAASKSHIGLEEILSEYRKSATQNLLGKVYNDVSPVMHEQGIPTSFSDLVHKPWFQYQLNRMAGTPEAQNPNPLAEKP